MFKDMETAHIKPDAAAWNALIAAAGAAEQLDRAFEVLEDMQVRAHTHIPVYLDVLTKRSRIRDTEH